MTSKAPVLPPFVRVLGVDVCIREAAETELDGDDVGRCFTNAALVIYDPRTDYQELRDTVLHELIHFIDHKLNGKQRLKEDQVCQLAAVLVPMLQDNLEFAKWLQSRD